MTIEEICRFLVSGPVGSAVVPDLADEDVRAEVRRRLQRIGCDLAYSEPTDTWVARLDGPLPRVDEHHPVVALHSAELALLAAAWLHLKFLSGERARLEVADADELLAEDDQPPSVEVDDLVSQFHGKLNRGYVENIVLGHLKKLGFLRQQAGRLYAGPMLDTIDATAATQQARLYVARHQRLAYLDRRAAELLDEGEDDAQAR